MLKVLEGKGGFGFVRPSRLRHGLRGGVAAGPPLPQLPKTGNPLGLASMHVCAPACICVRVRACMCICVHVRVCARACMYVHMCARACMYVHMCARACACVHVCAYVCACVPVRACMCTCVRVRACMCICVRMRARAYVCACARVLEIKTKASARVRRALQRCGHPRLISN
jgi:hypothetical protein